MHSCTPVSVWYDLFVDDTYPQKYIKTHQQRVQEQPNNEALLRQSLISCEELLNLREEAQKYHVSPHTLRFSLFRI